MALASGTKLGPYEILFALGAGGMGEVYRARDPRLGREVAIKVLPSGSAPDSERLRRFEQEARATAALNHPNILAVFDIGSQDNSPYIVSELLDGETLRARLNSGALPVRKAVEYALQISRGLAAAHDHGIFHRDLKPENIFITRDGHVKILDFGLAKLTMPEPGTPGLSVQATLDSATGRGVLLGTLGYMSPEQCRGAAVDARSDIFSFGAVLYEMVSGKRAFRGDTTADTISSILKEEPPDLSASGRDVSPMLERIVHHCLEKDPAARFQSARDVAFALEALSSFHRLRQRYSYARRYTAAPHPENPGSLLRSWSYRRPNCGRGVSYRSRERPCSRAALLPSAHVRSRVHRFCAFCSRPANYHLRHSSGRNQTELFSLAPDSHAPVSLGLKDVDVESISSTGEMLLIQQRHSLVRVARVGLLARAPLGGAAPRPMMNDVADADWGPDNQVAVARYVDGHFRIEYPIGHVLYEPSAGYVNNVRVSPKGDWVAFAEHPTLGDDAGYVVMVDSSGRKRTLSPRQSAIEGMNWAPSGKEVWFTGAMGGIEFQLRASDLSGHTRVVDRIPGTPALFDVARDGRVLLGQGINRVLTYARGPGQDQEHDVSVQNWSEVLSISPDGRLLLNDEGAGSGPDYDVLVRASDGAAPVRIGDGIGYDFSPDMKWVLSSLTLHMPRQLFLIPLGTGETKQITHDLIDRGRARFLPDGKNVVFTGTEPGHKSRIYVQAIDSGTARPISPEGVSGFVPTPDGKFVFGFSDSVALYPVDGQGPPRPVPGIHPGEAIFSVSPDGRTALVGLLYAYAVDVMRVDLASGRRELFKKIGPSDPAGVLLIDALFTPDGQYYAYSYFNGLSQLYLVEGLR